jgi:hypothetical protein
MCRYQELPEARSISLLIFSGSESLIYWNQMYKDVVLGGMNSILQMGCGIL